jgi:hypothetical protein
MKKPYWINGRLLTGTYRTSVPRLLEAKLPLGAPDGMEQTNELDLIDAPSFGQPLRYLRAGALKAGHPPRFHAREVVCVIGSRAMIACSIAFSPCRSCFPSSV